MIELDDYQLDAIREMKNGCILCGGVGSGKSRTALAYYYIQMGGKLGTEYYTPMDDSRIKDLYIITTARKRDTCEWNMELPPFCMTTEQDASIYRHDIVIDSWNNLHKYEGVKNAFFIFDEQRVTGKGEWVKSFLRITKENEWILLSATPGDTWEDYIPVFIANGFYKNRTEFTRQHCVYSRFTTYPKIDRYLNTGRLIRLRNSILVQMDYSNQAMGHHEDIYTDYDISAYKDIIRSRWNPWTNAPIVNASEYCQCLRKIVNSDLSRQEELIRIVGEKKRVIVFYNYDYELEILRGLDYGRFTQVAEWNGHKHQDIPDTPRWVFLVQYNAGAEGWNCTKTDTMVFYSQSYSYKQMTQAAGRIDRRNTPYLGLYYYHFKSRASIDVAISQTLKKKKQFNEGAFYGKSKNS